eukprot:243159-Amphidinium_carterae.1
MPTDAKVAAYQLVRCAEACSICEGLIPMSVRAESLLLRCVSRYQPDLRRNPMQIESNEERRQGTLSKIYVSRLAKPPAP